MLEVEFSGNYQRVKRGREKEKPPYEGKMGGDFLISGIHIKRLWFPAGRKPRES